MSRAAKKEKKKKIIIKKTFLLTFAKNTTENQTKITHAQGEIRAGLQCRVVRECSSQRLVGPAAAPAVTQAGGAHIDNTAESKDLPA
jgi:hypothetical protein